MLFPDFFAPSREVHLGSTQACDGRVLEEFGDFLGDVGEQPQLAGVDHRADSRRCVRLGIECLVLTGAALLKKKDYRLAGERVRLALGQVLPEKRGKNGLLFDQF